MSVLVVAALAAEAARVPDGLDVVVTGLGKTAAAVAVTAALCGRDREGLAVVNIGTAGALRDGLDGLHEIGTVLNHDINADVLRSLGVDPHEVIELGRPGAVLASGDLFVHNPVDKARLAERADLVDMEGYAVAYAGRHFDVPVRLVKHVSDNADGTALDWPAALDRSARALGAWLEENL
ncbi:MAG TPA: nucleosidase [Nocardioidaceae bacterium]|nr:nucleosidase [Nocardioidaceae bacterium]